jgi:hypothetical protein
VAGLPLFTAPTVRWTSCESGSLICGGARWITGAEI